MKDYLSDMAEKIVLNAIMQADDEEDVNLDEVNKKKVEKYFDDEHEEIRQLEDLVYPIEEVSV